MSDLNAFEPLRGRLTGLAYRMLGSRADADDAVQDAFLRWSTVDRAAVANAEAYLVRVVTRLCLDRLKSARARREVYVGQWLPEPVLDADALSPERHTELADDLSFALLLALDRLSPSERAAFLLHDVFDAPFSEIAVTLDKSEAACRQLATRARNTVREARSGAPSHDEHERLLSAFAYAASSGDLVALKSLLAEHVISLSDGGGRKSAALNPLLGADHTARYFIGITKKFGVSSAKLARLNGTPGLLLYNDNDLDSALMIALEHGKIVAIYTVRNPEKLKALQ